MADRIDITCDACRTQQSFTIDNLRSIGGHGYLECYACSYFNYIEDAKEKLNGN